MQSEWFIYKKDYGRASARAFHRHGNFYFKISKIYKGKNIGCVFCKKIVPVGIKLQYEILGIKIRRCRTIVAHLLSKYGNYRCAGYVWNGWSKKGSIVKYILFENMSKKKKKELEELFSTVTTLDDL